MLKIPFAIIPADHPDQPLCPYCHGHVTPHDESDQPSFTHHDPCREAQLHHSNRHIPPYPLDQDTSNWSASLSHTDQPLLAEIQAGQATIAQFRQWQSRLIEREHERLAQEALAALTVPFPLTKTDQHRHFATMRSFCQLQLGATLFLTQFKTTKGPAWAGGVTYQSASDIEQRLYEKLKRAGPVRLLSYEEIPQAGGVWSYVLHRYPLAGWRKAPIGLHVSHMSPDTAEQLRAELAEAAITAWELSLLAGEHTAVSQALEDRWTHSRHTRAGMRQTDKVLGRPIEPAAQTLAKYPTAVGYLRGGMSIRTTATAVGISKNTVLKVKRLLEGRW